MKNKKLKSLISIILSLILIYVLVKPTGTTFPYTNTIDSFIYEDIVVPKYDGDVSEIVNNNVPLFTNEELEKAKDNTYEFYGELDELGRCTYAMASLNISQQPKYERGSISDIKPTGWIQNRYDFLGEDGHLYERCHLIAYMFTGVDNEHSKKKYAKQNLITGTSYMNAGLDDESGMNEYEIIVKEYLDEHSSSNILYRVTPIFDGDDLLAKGVLMEAKSLDDDEIEFCVFVYNVEPNIQIDYATGDNKENLSLFQSIFMN